MKKQENIKAIALGLLARREHSRRELERKLLIRGFTPSSISALMEKLESADILSEDRFVSAFIYSRRIQGFGPLKICVELQKRGIYRHQVLENEQWQASAWENCAKGVREKRFGLTLPKDTKSIQRQMAFLQQRGFTMEQIAHALKQTIDESSK